MRGTRAISHRVTLFTVCCDRARVEVNLSRDKRMRWNASFLPLRAHTPRTPGRQPATWRNVRLMQTSRAPRGLAHPRAFTPPAPARSRPSLLRLPPSRIGVRPLHNCDPISPRRSCRQRRRRHRSYSPQRAGPPRERPAASASRRAGHVDAPCNSATPRQGPSIPAIAATDRGPARPVACPTLSSRAPGLSSSGCAAPSLAYPCSRPSGPAVSPW